MAEVSQEAKAMVSQGATPAFVDVNQMLSTIQTMQAQIDSLLAERGVPADPLEAAVKNLLDHVRARQAQYPQHDFSDLVSELEGVQDLRPVPRDNAELISVLVADLVEAGKQFELSYLPQLARDLHKEVLKQD